MPRYRLQLIDDSARALRVITFSCNDENTARIVARLEFDKSTASAAAQLWQDSRRIEKIEKKRRPRR
jgi:hypothetical protein